MQRFVTPLLLLLAWCLGAAAEESGGIALYYFDRPPFAVTEADGRVTGLFIEPTNQVFAAAGLPMRWVKTPTNRIMPLLKASEGMDCSPGWYWTAERNSFLRYTRPIYVDKPFIALVRADYDARDGMSSQDLLARADLRMTLRRGLAHGDYVDALVAKMPPQNVTQLSIGNGSIAKMIAAGRTDLTIMTDEEVDIVLAEAGIPRQTLRAVHFADMPRGEQRFIVCSKRVPADTIERLNHAIRDLIAP